MMPTTPNGTAMRSMSSPFGRVQRASAAADRVGQLGDGFEPGGDRLHPLAIERQPVPQGRGEPLGLGEVAGVGGQDLGFAGAREPRGSAQARGLGFARSERESGGGGAGALPDLGHLARQRRVGRRCRAVPRRSLAGCGA